MKNLMAGDSIIFTCNQELVEEQDYPLHKRVDFQGEIEKVIREVKVNENNLTKTLSSK